MTVRIIIADDHAVVRDGLRSLMEGYPEIEVVGDASNGHQSICMVKELKPDIVLMDISMPDMSGIDATREILNVNPETRVIILSMLGTPEHVFRALQAGVQGYLLKESASREVIDAILCVAGGKNYFSQPVTNTLISDYVHLRENTVRENPLKNLSQREREILQLVLDGKSSAEIGDLLHLSRKTVESYRYRMMQKLGVEDMHALLRFAMHEGLID